ncbi:MAG: TolC family protein [Candidatus Margulisbacteria bacterium]|nr:TolC family protein [Candidatus Margulisiibacteriota bacterium]
MQNKYKLIIGWLALGSLVLSAETFTLENAIDYALQHSPQYRVIYKDKEISRAQSFAGYGEVLPQLNYSYTESTRKSPSSPEMVALGMGGDETRTKIKELSAQQLLFSVNGLAALKASLSSGRLADYTYADSKEQFVLSVKKAFFDLQMSRELLRLNQELAAQTEHYARNAQLMFDNGTIARSELLNARIQLYEAQKNLTNAGKAAAAAGYNLNTLIGLPLTQNTALAAYNVTVDETFLTKNLDAVELAEQAYALRPSFLAFHEAVELNKAAYLNAWGSSLPALYYVYSKQSSEYDPASLMSPDGDTETWALSAKWNFFAGGANWFQIHEKANNRDKYAEQEKIQRNAVLIEIQSALDELRAQLQTVLGAREQNQLAAESLRIAQINFESGNGTSTQLNDALIQRQSSATNLIKALYDYEYAAARLNYAAGQKII